MVTVGTLGTIAGLNGEVSTVPFEQVTAAQASPDSLAVVPEGAITGGLSTGLQEPTPVNRRFNIGEKIYVHTTGTAASGTGQVWLEIETGGAAQDASGRDARGRFQR